MKVEDQLYIAHEDVVLSIEIEAWQTISSDNPPELERPEGRSYPEEAAEFAEALEKVREALVELDETPDDEANGSASDKSSNHN